MQKKQDPGGPEPLCTCAAPSGPHGCHHHPSLAPTENKIPLPSLRYKLQLITPAHACPTLDDIDDTLQMPVMVRAGLRVRVDLDRTYEFMSAACLHPRSVAQEADDSYQPIAS